MPLRQQVAVIILKVKGEKLTMCMYPGAEGIHFLDLTICLVSYW